MINKLSKEIEDRIREIVLEEIQKYEDDKLIALPVDYPTIISD